MFTKLTRNTAVSQNNSPINLAAASIPVSYISSIPYDRAGIVKLNL